MLLATQYDPADPLPTGTGALPRRHRAPLPDSPHALALRPEQLARRLGVCRRQLYRLLKHPDPSVRLPAPFKIGRATFWRPEEVEDWLRRQGARRAA